MDGSVDDASASRDRIEALRERGQRVGLAPLWEELARRYSASATAVATITLRELNDESRNALADLLGLDRLLPATCRIPVTRLASALGIDEGEVRALVELLTGPLANRAGERNERTRQREDLWNWLAHEVQGRGLEDWVVRLRMAGVPAGDVVKHRQRLEDVLSVLHELPADGIALPALAADVLRDPHGLDYGTWTGRVTVEAIAMMHHQMAPRTAEEMRTHWHLVGVVADMLSPSVLTLGIRPAGNDPLADMLRAMSQHAEPTAVTFAQLNRWPLGLSESVIYVFENPSLLAEAARTGWTGAPLICTSGWPNVAVLTLMRQAASAGCELRLHCDFDPKGLEIAHTIAERVGATPWRMRREDYELGLARAAAPITTSVPDSPWDPQLAEAMRQHSLIVFEEDIRDELLGAAERFD